MFNRIDDEEPENIFTRRWREEQWGDEAYEDAAERHRRWRERHGENGEQIP